MRLTDIEILSALENLRIRKINSVESPEHIIRICSAIIAKNAGYSSREEWTKDAVAAGLVKYFPTDRQEEAEQAKLQYFELMSKLNAKEA